MKRHGQHLPLGWIGLSPRWRHGGALKGTKMMERSELQNSAGRQRCIAQALRRSWRKLSAEEHDSAPEPDRAPQVAM